MKRKIDAMHRECGELKLLRCRGCSHLVQNRMGRMYYKCECYGLSASEATDWAKSWTACGLYGQPAPEVPLLEKIKHAPRRKPDAQIDGQIGMDDIITQEE